MAPPIILLKCKSDYVFPRFKSFDSYLLPGMKVQIPLPGSIQDFLIIWLWPNSPTSTSIAFSLIFHTLLLSHTGYLFAAIPMPLPVPALPSPWPTGRGSPSKIQFKCPKAFSHQTSSPFHPDSARPKIPSLCPTAPRMNLQYGTPMAEQVVAFPSFHKIVSSYIFMSHSFKKKIFTRPLGYIDEQNSWHISG